MATIEIPDYLLEVAETTSNELNAELATLTPQEAVDRLQKISKSVQDFFAFCKFRTTYTSYRNDWLYGHLVASRSYFNAG